MRYAIFGCVHGNLPALQLVLEDARAQNCSRFAFLGDAVGYGRQPKECVDLLRSLEIEAVKGNHDEYASSDEPLPGFKPAALENLLWTRTQLTEEDRQWLRALPYVRQLSAFTIVHAVLDHPERWEYIFDKFGAARHFQFQNTSLCFFAHTHVPLAFIRDSVVRGGAFSTLKVEPNRMYFINAGSVGQSRDIKNKADYVIYDLEKRSIELRRLDSPGADPRQSGGDSGPAPVVNSPGDPPPFLSAAEKP